LQLEPSLLFPKFPDPFFSSRLHFIVSYYISRSCFPSFQIPSPLGHTFPISQHISRLATNARVQLGIKIYISCILLKYWFQALNNHRELVNQASKLWDVMVISWNELFSLYFIH
jgi:hypothetical protein